MITKRRAVGESIIAALVGANRDAIDTTLVAYLEDLPEHVHAELANYLKAADRLIETLGAE